MPHAQPPASRPDESLERYAAMLREAGAYRGTSLARDAWRRLCRNRVAIAALTYLTLVALLAFLTPLLPLEPPRRVDTERKFAPPSWSPVWNNTFPLTQKRLDEADQQYQAMRARRDQARAAGQKEEAAQLSAQLETVLYAPYNEAGLGELGLIARGLARLRVRLFGSGQFASLMGADDLGRDLLSRLFWGARVSLVVGFVATLVSLVIGVSYGAIAGFLGGWVDDLMMRVVDVLYSVPFIFIVIFLISILSDEAIKTQVLEPYGISRITIFYVVVGAIYWLTMARVVRGQVISLRNEQFVEAARVLGAGRPRIIFLHLVPNLFSVVIVYLTLTIPSVMLFEAFLSFLGLGVEPPDVSWGLLANDGLKVITPIKTYWWLVVFPGLALGSTLYALNFLGDGLRDALDPRLKNR